MAEWIRFQLGDGAVDGIQLLYEMHYCEMHTPCVPVPYTANRYSKNRSYCLGWFCEQYQGYTHLFHDGSYLGYSSFLSLFPEKRLGVAVLSNVSSGFVEAAALALAEEILDLTKIHWNRERLCGNLQAIFTKERRPGKDKPLCKPAHSFTCYPGSYRNPAYGILMINMEADKLYMNYYDARFELECLGDDIFAAKYMDEKDQAYIHGTIKFDINCDNSI